MLVAFYSPHLCLRGTTVAAFDYAVANQSVLGNESVVIFDRNHRANHPSAVKRFKEHVRTTAIDDASQLDQALRDLNARACYTLKGGFRDGLEPTACPALIHATAMAPPSERHGSRYAYVSEWMSVTLSGGQIPFVPHMVRLPDISDNLRPELGIPETATVFGRTGGPDTWNLPFANASVERALAARSDLWFVFQNTPEFTAHSKVRYIEPTADAHRKVRFINTCDAMLHARWEGESFGLACAEFSSRNKPIVTWSESRERSHIFHLQERGLYYTNEEDLVALLVSFEKRPNENWNCYTQFNAKAVMKIFQEVFLS